MKEKRSMQRTTMRAKIMRGIVTPLFVILAIISIALGVLNSTIWKPDSIINAYDHIIDKRYIITDPGVMNMVDNHVRIDVAVEGSRKPVCIALALAKDAHGWVSGYPVARITGLKDWNRLSSVSQEAEGKKDPVLDKEDSAENKNSLNGSSNSDGSSSSGVNSGVNSDTNSNQSVPFNKSDLWASSTCQLGLARLSVNLSDFVQTHPDAYMHTESGKRDENGLNISEGTKNDAGSSSSQSTALRSQLARRVFLIDLGDNAKNAYVEMRWRRHTIPDFATPLYFVGALLLIMAALSATVFAMSPHRRRNKRLIASRSMLLEAESNNKRVEVSIIEAFAGTFAELFGSHHKRKSSSSHARHGVHARKKNKENIANQNNEQKYSVVIRDDNSSSTSKSKESYANIKSSDFTDETAVISRDELQSYFARLAQESYGDSSNKAVRKLVENADLSVMSSSSSVINDSDGENREYANAREARDLGEYESDAYNSDVSSDISDSSDAHNSQINGDFDSEISDATSEDISDYDSGKSRSSCSRGRKRQLSGLSGNGGNIGNKNEHGRKRSRQEKAQVNDRYRKIRKNNFKNRNSSENDGE